MVVHDYKEIFPETLLLWFMAGAQIDELLFVLFIRLWLGVILDSLVIGVKNQLAGVDGLECQYFVLCGLSLHLKKCFKLFLRFCMNSDQGCSAISKHVDALCECARHTLQYRTLSSTSVDALLTVVEVELTNDATTATFTSVTPILPPLYDRRGDLLLGDPILLSVLYDDSIYDCSACSSWLCTQLTAPLNVTWPRGLSTTLCGTPDYARGRLVVAAI